MSAKNPAAVALGRLGGSVTSEAKASAARENGKKGGARGERHGRSRITWADVWKMRTLWADGAKQRDIAKQFGMSAGNVSLIVRGKRWKA